MLPAQREPGIPCMNMKGTPSGSPNSAYASVRPSGSRIVWWGEELGSKRRHSLYDLRWSYPQAVAIVRVL
jgi:hypothetical protein